MDRETQQRNTGEHQEVQNTWLSSWSVSENGKIMGIPWPSEFVKGDYRFAVGF